MAMMAYLFDNIDILFCLFTPMVLYLFLTPAERFRSELSLVSNSTASAYGQTGPLIGPDYEVFQFFGI